MGVVLSEQAHLCDLSTLLMPRPSVIPLPELIFVACVLVIADDAC